MSDGLNDADRYERDHERAIDNAERYRHQRDRFMIALKGAWHFYCGSKSEAEFRIALRVLTKGDLALMGVDKQELCMSSESTCFGGVTGGWASTCEE